MLIRESHLDCDDASLVFDEAACSFASQFSIDAGPQLDQEAVAMYLIVVADFDRISSTVFRMRPLYWANTFLCEITYFVRTGIASGTLSRQCHPRRRILTGADSVGPIASTTRFGDFLKSMTKSVFEQPDRTGRTTYCK